MFEGPVGWTALKGRTRVVSPRRYATTRALTIPLTPSRATGDGPASAHAVSAWCDQLAFASPSDSYARAKRAATESGGNAVRCAAHQQCSHCGDAGAVDATRGAVRGHPALSEPVRGSRTAYVVGGRRMQRRVRDRVAPAIEGRLRAASTIWLPRRVPEPGHPTPCRIRATIAR